MIIANRLHILGHPQRLAIFRLLMRRYPDRVAAGEIAAALGLKPSTLSAYLAALMQAGLVSQKRDSRSLLYRVEMTAARQSFDYLILDCCRGRPDACSPLSGMGGRGAGRLNVLFLCSGNSARSIFAEAILRDLSGDRFAAFSAGTQPRAAPHPQALALLAARGHDTGALRAKSLRDFQRPDAPQMDVVLTVCDRAANEDGPAWPGAPVTGHFSTPDPVDTGDAAAFQRAYDSLHSRISQLAADLRAEMKRDEKQRVVDLAAHLQGDVT